VDSNDVVSFQLSKSMRHPNGQPSVIKETVILGYYFARLEPLQTRKEPLTIFWSKPLLPEQAIALQRFGLNADDIEYV
jgi:hypothetical protein